MAESSIDDKERIVTNVPKDLKEKASYVAKMEHKTVSSLLCQLLSEYVESRYSEYQLLEEIKTKAQVNIPLNDLSRIIHISDLYISDESIRNLIFPNKEDGE